MKKYATVKIIPRDISIPKLKKRTKELAGYEVKVGINKEEAKRVINKSGFTQLDNALLQEFGGEQVVAKTRRFKNSFGKWFYIKAGTVIRTPARVFIRIFSTSHKFRAYLQFELLGMFNRYFRQRLGAKELWDKTGIYARDAMRERITLGQVSPQNSDMTVEYKGRNKPLYSGGQLVDDIKHKVVKK